MEITKLIREAGLKEFEEHQSGLMIMELEKYMEKYAFRIMNPHRPVYFQVLFIVSGEGRIRLDENVYEFNSPAVFTIPKGQIVIVEPKVMLKGFVLNFSEELFCQYSEGIFWLNSLMLFNRSIQPQVKNFNKKEFNEFLGFIKKIQLEFFNSDSFAKDEILISLIKSLLLYIERCKRKNRNERLSENFDRDYLNEFENALENNFTKNRSVQFYSDYLNITPKKLNKILVRYSGKSGKQLIEERVMLEIKRLLLYTNLSLKEIGYSLGFSDPTNFNKFFKKFEGITPTNFRESGKKTDFHHGYAVKNHQQAFL